MNSFMYQVDFEPRSKKVCAMGFNISASSLEEAERQAKRLMLECGESLNHFKRPIIRKATYVA